MTQSGYFPDLLPEFDLHPGCPYIPLAQRTGYGFGWRGRWDCHAVDSTSRLGALVGVVLYRLFGFRAVPSWVWR